MKNKLNNQRKRLNVVWWANWGGFKSYWAAFPHKECTHVIFYEHFHSVSEDSNYWVNNYYRGVWVYDFLWDSPHRFTFYEH